MVKEREEWASRPAFILAAIGSAIGLGNVWRFPYICYQNGGGAFLIPYFVALLTAGIPLVILEYGIGLRMKGSAALSFAKVGKKWEWVGWWPILIVFVTACYYTIIMAWAMNYFIYSFTLAWGSDTATFFNQVHLKLTEGPGQLGGIITPIFITLIISWTAIYFIISKGVKSVGKVVWWTVTTPFIIIIILVIRGLTLPGAIEGIKYYLTPDFSRLLDPSVWLAAYGQIFFTLSLAWGVLIAYASYLPKDSDVNNNAFITGFANCGTSFLAGFAVFGILGYMAQTMGVGVADVVKGGFGLAFIAYPTGINLLPFGQPVFGALFFLLLITLAIDSAFSFAESVVAGIMDKWGISRMKANLIVCGSGFLGGLIFITGAGLYWLDVVDHFMSNFGLTLVGLAECLVIGYVFKAAKLRQYTNKNSDFIIGRWWDVCIKVITPAIIVVMFVMTLIERINVPYMNYPKWFLMSAGFGLSILVFGLSFVFMSFREEEK